MIAQLRGAVIEATIDKDALRVTLDVNGVGYEVFMCRANEGRIVQGRPATLYISESVTAFDGATTLYGFATRDEKDLFRRLRENVDGMGPKKALETMDKISKSMPDFKRAIIDADTRLLVSVFGFTKKTADKLVFALKGKVEGWAVTGAVRWQEAPASGGEAEAVSGLVNLGYREEDARELVARARGALGDAAPVESILQEALKLMGAKL